LSCKYYAKTQTIQIDPNEVKKSTGFWQQPAGFVNLNPRGQSRQKINLSCAFLMQLHKNEPVSSEFRTNH